MNTHSQILVVSRDQMLLQTRRLILGTYFDVEAAGRISEAGSILAKRDFDLIVLCDTLSDAECQQIAQMVREQCPQPTLLSILGPGNKGHDREVGRTLALAGGPLQLLKECADALGTDLRGKQRSLAVH
jgi:DNA-binding response OmpR family regulator